MYGWTGRILEVDLTSGAHREVRLQRDVYRRFIGGRGLAGYLLSEHVTLPWDDPAMPLLFMTGPLCGTAAPASSRMTIMSRSPLTGTVGDASVGGALGAQLKAVGLDGVCVVGRSASPVGIQISTDSVRLVDASGLRDLPTSQVREYVGLKWSVAAIGPAAEHGVRFSSIIVDGHFAAARGGIGLVMASKNMKFLAVRGTGRTDVADDAELRAARQEILRLVAASPALLGEQGIASLGTPALYDLMHVRRMMPTANFRRTFFEPAPELGAHALAAQYHPKSAGCHGCPIMCKKIAADGRPMPEFETLSHFTALLENADLEVAMQANALCNDLGMDTISAASTVACQLEIAKRTATGEELLEALRSMGRGGPLAEGSAIHARNVGRAQASMSVKGQELPAYDPRGAYGMALSYATSTRGGCHLRAYPISHEILRKPVATDRFSFDGKARIVKIAEDNNAVIDSLVACKFVFFGATLEEYARALSAVTGVPMAAHELTRVGERIVYHERMMNALNGFSAHDDDLPRRFFEDEGSSGAGIEVRPLDRSEFLEARARYYRCRGLDDAGMPTREKAQELDLPWRE